ncbi:MAG: hypothetical protein ACRD22_06410, partial [Terriglobia bacterium]
MKSSATVISANAEIHMDPRFRDGDVGNFAAQPHEPLAHYFARTPHQGSLTKAERPAAGGGYNLWCHYSPKPSLLRITYYSDTDRCSGGLWPPEFRRSE